MDNTTVSKVRFLLFVVWGLSMLSAYLAMIIIAPRQAALVPCVLIVLMVPMVLLPFKKNPSGNRKA